MSSPGDYELDNTNKILSELNHKLSNRQFSNTSSTYSNLTQQSNHSLGSQGSSVIINRNLSDTNRSGDHNTGINDGAAFQSNVLQYIKQNQHDDFNANDLFQQRQQRKFVTKFGKSYHHSNNHDDVQGTIDDDTQLKPLSYSLPRPPSATPHDDDQLDDNNDNNNNEGDDVHSDAPRPIATTTMFRNHQTSTIDRDLTVDDAATVNADDDINFVNDDNDNDDFNDKFMNSYDDDEEDDDIEDDDDDMLMPPSPPRSPPKELDPDKLYGLYDFSGPDPSHCSITRDEPVFLINDQDNYWWLIQKLTKQQRIQLLTERKRNDSGDDLDNENHSIGESSLDEILTDEEDGKVGFVPAECLETYGERLARLNCFKNEELERSSKDLIIKTSNPSSSDNIATDNNKSYSSIGLGSPVNLQKSPDTTLSRSGSILRDPNTTKLSINKSVTFEDLSLVENAHEDDDDNDDYDGGIATKNSVLEDEDHTPHILEDDDDSIQEQDFPEHYYNLPPRLEVTHDDEKRSEVLSDVYPSETPLIINKRKDSPLPVKQMQTFETEGSPTPITNSFADMDGPESTNESPEIIIDDIKSPQTPASNYQTPNLISSAVFDKASQSDNEYKTPNGKTTSTASTPQSERLRRSQILDKLTQVTSDIQNELDMDVYNPYYNQGNFLSVFENGSFSSKGLLVDSDTKASSEPNPVQNHTTSISKEINSDGQDDDNDSGYEELVNQIEESYHEDDPKDLNVTPLTSTNSLNPNATDLVDKRKSKPVHDMFMPILGKFDELAEKLAEIDDML